MPSACSRVTNSTSVEKALTEISPFLCTNATLAVLIDSCEARLEPGGSDEASTDGVSDRGGREVPSRTGAVRFPAGLQSDRKCRVTRWLRSQIRRPGSPATFPDIPTPFDEAGAVDLNAFAGFANDRYRPASQRSSSCETTGEFSTLTSAELDAIIRTAAEIGRGRVRVIAGAGSNSTGQAARAGAAGRTGRRRRPTVGRALL